MADPFLDAFHKDEGAATTSDPFLSAFGSTKRSAFAATDEEVAALEGQAAAAGAPAIGQESPGAFRRILDVLSRPNYAIAGAAEEMFSPQAAQTAEGPLGRAGREFFSGIGGLQGEKRGFGEVMERAGVGTGPKVSDVLPVSPGGILDITARGTIGTALDVFLDPTTYLGFGVAGRTAKVGGKFLSRTGQKALTAGIEAALPTVEGVLDISKAARPVVTSAIRATKTAAELAGELPLGSREILQNGIEVGSEGYAAARKTAVSTAQDRIAGAIKAGRTDYLDRGGIKWMGYTIAESPFKALAESGLSKQMVERLGQTGAGNHVMEFAQATKKHIFDPIGGLFIRGYGIKGLEGALPVIQDNLNKIAYLRSLMDQEIAESPFKAFLRMDPDKRAATFKGAIDAYEVGGLQAVKPEYREAIQYFARKKKDLLQVEMEAGIRTGELPNYVAHFFENDPEDFDKVMQAWRGRPARMLDPLARHAEHREFDTLAQAAEVSARLHADNAAVPVLKPVYDPVEILRRRWENSIQGRTRRELVKELGQKFGQVPYDINELRDLIPKSIGRKLTAAEAKTLMSVSEQVAKGGTDVKFVRGLSDQAKGEFFRQRFARIGSRDEAAKVLAKYQEFEGHFPKVLNTYSDLAADGSPFITYKIGNVERSIPKSLARELEGLDDRVIKSRELRTIMDGYDRAMNFWKGSVTWIFPAFHVRNFYSNVAQSFVDIALASLNPAEWTKTGEILFTKRPGILKTALGNYSNDEVRAMLMRNGVTVKPEQLAEFTGKGLKPAISPIGKIPEVGRAVGASIENEARAQLFINYIKRGMNEAEAGARVNKFQLDYANGLTSFERQWMRRAIPFYAFQRMNFGLMLENLKKRPGMLLTELKPFRGRDEENQQMTSWDAGALKLRLAKDGKTVSMLTGIDLPIRNLDLLFRGSIKDTVANVIGMTSPAIKGPIELAMGKSFFTGKDFGRPQSLLLGKMIEHMPQPVQNWMGYKKEFDSAGRPRFTFDGERFYLVAQSYAFSRIISTTDRQWREYLGSGGEGFAASMMDLLTGLRYKELNLDEEKQRRLDERKRQLEQVLVRWGQRRQFERTYQPKVNP